MMGYHRRYDIPLKGKDTIADSPTVAIGFHGAGVVVGRFARVLVPAPVASSVLGLLPPRFGNLSSGASTSGCN